ncbi:PREDICTED: uncharacterized protein LOC105124666 [Populus euphratica]|uniref:Uncharacterized protein LOC105124666 n=1 Tax=Populus euphratica TaxID=75702 RepID=A0AAJ6U4B5_POPEU|nr:PREDICTED: uncharacterized protein LOC105124666 [Populus euphratica]
MGGPSLNSDSLSSLKPSKPYKNRDTRKKRIRREGKKEMQSLSPLRSALGSISASLPRGTFSSISRHAAPPGCLERLGGSFWSIHDVARGENARHASWHSGHFGMSFGLLTSKEDVTVPYALSFQSFIHSMGHKDFETGRDSNPEDFAAGREDFEMERSSMQNSNLEMERNPRSMNFSAGRRDFEMGRSSMQNSNLEMGRNPRSMNFSAGQRDFEMERGPRPDFYAGGRNSRPMDFVRGVIEQEGSRFPQYHVELNDDFVFMKLKRNNTFVAVTDSKGNKKKNASMTAGWLQKLQGGAKLSRYAAEATAEHVGQAARQLGLKSFVMRVNGFTYFKKKRLAITSFAEGYGKGGLSPIKHIEDNTRRPHNGCRLPRKRRI